MKTPPLWAVVLVLSVVAIVVGLIYVATHIGNDDTSCTQVTASCPFNDPQLNREFRNAPVIHIDFGKGGKS
jgi:hypothetical protein